MSFATFIDEAGKNLNLPEFGLSELLNGGNSTTNTTADTKDNFGIDKNKVAYTANGVSYNYAGDPISKTSNTAANDTGLVDNSQLSDTSSYSTSSSGSGYTASDERAAYDDQIAALNRLLGYTNTQKDAGLSSMADKFNYEKNNLDSQYQRTLDDYQQKQDANAQSKEKGLGEVDQFANSSYNNLRRLLQGGNAGNSSVARELMPYLVSKSATTRRTGVFDTAGQNDKSIADAKGDAEYQYGTNSQDLQNSRKSSEQSFLETILNKQNELASSKKDLEIKRAMANGTGYAAARASADSTQSGINDRQSQLASLFGQYKPTYTAKAITAKTPSLGTYTVDKAALSSNNPNLPAESSFYLNQMKKKQELGL